jgi:hypothetical protein
VRAAAPGPVLRFTADLLESFVAEQGKWLAE